MSNLKKVLWATALLGLVVCGFIAFTIYNAIFVPNTAFNNEEAHVYVPSNATFAEVKQLVAPLLKNPSTFEAVAERKGYATNVKPGKYALRKGMNNNEIINSLRSGNIPVMVTFNNQEGLSDLAGRIAQQLEADSSSLLAAFKAPSFLKETGFTKETALGMYLPNTYELFWNTSANAFRDRMLKEYQRYWNDTRTEKAKALNLSKAEVLALASIVQKETVKVDERPRVAGVYLNRLKRGMLLQADPTVIYAIKKETGNYDTIIKRVLNRDLEIDSPYNTYKYKGLPPGPISMADISSIEAVLNAEKHDYLFFVVDLQKPGYHRFAKTLRQHNQNKRHYTQWLDRSNIYR